MRLFGSPKRGLPYRMSWRRNEMWSAIAALKGILRVRQSGTKWRLFGFLRHASTSEHGIAGHDRLALSVRSWSSCSIAAMRRLKSENLEFFCHCVDWHAVKVDRTRALVTRLWL